MRVGLLLHLRLWCPHCHPNLTQLALTFSCFCFSLQSTVNELVIFFKSSISTKKKSIPPIFKHFWNKWKQNIPSSPCYGKSNSSIINFSNFEKVMNFSWQNIVKNQSMAKLSNQHFLKVKWQIQQYKFIMTCNYQDTSAQRN